MAVVFDVHLFNVVVLGLAFMFLFTAFQTSSMIEQTIINSFDNETYHKTGHHFKGSGYYSLSIIYAIFAAANWIAPSVVALIGPRLSMFSGGIVYTLFILSFIKPMVWSLYTGSVLLGVAAAIIWTGQGNYLTINSNSDTMARNSGIFWALLQCSLLFGNLFIYFEWQGTDTIEDSMRRTVYIVLTVIAAIGVALLLLLRDKRPEDTNNLLSVNSSVNRVEKPWNALVRSFQLFCTKELLLLSVCFFYTGLELTFFSGVYGTSIGNVGIWGEKAKGYIGLVGTLIGCGEIIGGATFGILGDKTNKYGRDPIVLLGYVVHIISFYLILLNLPSETPIQKAEGNSYIQPSIGVALLCAFLLGFGDSCFNTQIYSIVGYMFPEDSAPAFALFKFTQSLAAAAGFFYSNHLVLHWQLLILVIFGTMGTLCFFKVERIASDASDNGYSKIGKE
ncbi:UNC93-like protein MFSD11 [Anneissia japonica]|uniref:UNC93-like protein MFSD11 n=1 Tax=Anneissia japonica TaxID=1529436 RepID=UPI00142581F6|nr:UNC93-like protein MFSD11 [Anneissia japonica]